MALGLETMIPKSTSKLKRGDFCLVPRVDGLFVPLVYVEKPPRTRATFFGTLAPVAVVGADRLPQRIDIVGPLVNLGIDFFREHQVPIVGNLLHLLNQDEVSCLAEDALHPKVGSIISVWGHLTVLRKANEIPAQPAISADGPAAPSGRQARG